MQQYGRRVTDIDATLRRSEQQARLALEVARLGTWTWSVADNLILADARCRQIFGVDRYAELTLDGVLERVHPDDRAAVRHALHASLVVGDPGRYKEDLRFVHADGTVRFAVSRGRTQFEGEGVARHAVEVFGSIIDVTDQITISDKYRSLFDSIDQGFCLIEVLFDDDGAPIDYRFLETNARFAEQTGLVGVIGECVSTLVPGYERRWMDIYGRVATTGEPVRFEQQAKALDRWYEVSAYRVGDPLARQVAVLFADITQRKSAQEGEREADRRKDAFLATLAHELRNPLAPLRTSLHVLKATDEPQTVTRLYDIMGRQVDQLSRLVDDLMEVSRITRGQIELRLEPVDLASVLRNAVETSRPQVEQSGQTLSMTLPHTPLHVHADAVRLAQVVTNLLNNAARYGKPGGNIALRLWHEDGEAAIAVRDDGIGIPPEKLQEVFELFTQLDRHSSNAHGGLGIGLSLVRSLVQMHGGSVAAMSDGPGLGSEFVVKLPLRTACDVESQQGGTHIAESLANLRVLVADDNRDAADSMGEWLSQMGAETCVTHGGRAALSALHDLVPDVVLLDLGMPDIDGFEVARQLRADPRFDATRVIALTGWGQAVDRERTAASGFDGHLTKPADIAALLAVLMVLPRAIAQ
ncbi:MAG: domain S-box protein [Xanthomonadaceae bacterium]|nr:domain S-box protein [Xanthomonadaceae bacterium]